MNKILLLFFMQFLDIQNLSSGSCPKDSFAAKLKRLKELKELSPEKVADIAGTSKTTVQCKIQALNCLNRFENYPKINAYLTHIDEHAAQEKPLDKAPFNRLVVYLEKNPEPTTAQALVAILELLL